MFLEKIAVLFVLLYSPALDRKTLLDICFQLSHGGAQSATTHQVFERLSISEWTELWELLHQLFLLERLPSQSIHETFLHSCVL